MNDLTQHKNPLRSSDFPSEESSGYVITLRKGDKALLKAALPNQPAIGEVLQILFCNYCERLKAAGVLYYSPENVKKANKILTEMTTSKKN